MYMRVANIFLAALSLHGCAICCSKTKRVCGFIRCGITSGENTKVWHEFVPRLLLGDLPQVAIFLYSQEIGMLPCPARLADTYSMQSERRFLEEGAARGISIPERVRCSCCVAEQALVPCDHVEPCA
jgi:hypothetical protein